MNKTNIYPPNKEQIGRFVYFVIDVHSWYKHLPLFTGAPFTFYLEQNLDREYPSVHPKLPYGNNAEAYEKAFGQLFFKYIIDDTERYLFSSKSYLHDAKQHSGTVTVVLYPYCHIEFENGFSLMEDDFEKIMRGEPHENSKLLINYFNLLTEKEHSWQKLNEVERQRVLDFEDSDFDSSTEMKTVLPYFAISNKLESVRKQLQAFEISKIKNAISQVITATKFTN